MGYDAALPRTKGRSLPIPVTEQGTTAADPACDPLAMTTLGQADSASPKNWKISQSRTTVCKSPAATAFM